MDLLEVEHATKMEHMKRKQAYLDEEAARKRARDDVKMQILQLDLQQKKGAASPAPNPHTSFYAPHPPNYSMYGSPTSNLHLLS